MKSWFILGALAVIFMLGCERQPSILESDVEPCPGYPKCCAAKPPAGEPSACDQAGCFGLLANDMRTNLFCDQFLGECVFPQADGACSSNEVCQQLGFCDAQNSGTISYKTYKALIYEPAIQIDLSICAGKKLQAHVEDLTVTALKNADIQSAYSDCKTKESGTAFWSKPLDLSTCEGVFPDELSEDTQVSPKQIKECVSKNGGSCYQGDGSGCPDYMQRLSYNDPAIKNTRNAIIEICKMNYEAGVAAIAGIAIRDSDAFGMAENITHDLSNIASSQRRTDCVFGALQVPHVPNISSLSLKTENMTVLYPDVLIEPAIKAACKEAEKSSCKNTGSSYFNCRNSKTLAEYKSLMTTYIKDVCCDLVATLGLGFPSCLSGEGNAQ